MGDEARTTWKRPIKRILRLGPLRTSYFPRVPGPADLVLGAGKHLARKTVTMRPSDGYLEWTDILMWITNFRVNQHFLCGPLDLRGLLISVWTVICVGTANFCANGYFVWTEI